MPRVKLDATFALTATCRAGKKKTDYWDTQTTGFVLEVRSTGGRTYYLRYQNEHDRQCTKRIGGYNDITFDQARKEAKRLRSMVVLGGDPAAAKAHKRAIPTYAEFAAQHLSNAKTYQRSYSTTEMYMRRHIVPRWGKLHLDEIRQPEVAQWLAEKAAEGLAPATVEKIRVIFSRSFELAARWSVPGAEKNPTRGIPRAPINNARERFLSAEEAGALRLALENSPNRQLRYIVGLLLLTGARVSELLHAKWNMIAIEQRKWLIPTSKNGRSRWVPLSQSAIDLLAQVPRFPGCQYVVPNPDTLKPYVSVKRAWDTARRDAGMPDLRIHDLRHSAASFMINAGVDLYAVGKVLGHLNHKSTMRYSHLANDTLLAAVEAGAKKLQVDWSAAI